MDTLKAERTDFQTAKDLKTILGSQGPCLSVFIALNRGSANQNAKANGLEWKQAIRSVEPRIEQYGSAGRELLETVSDWDAITQSEAPQGKSIAVFRSPEIFRITWLEDVVKSRAVIGPHFYIRPLLPELTRDREFYILGLSQNNVRLLRCTQKTSEEISFPPGTVTSYEVYMNTAKPDHLSEGRSAPGPGSGGSKGIMFSTSADREAKDQYLAHFFIQIDRGLNEVLRGKTEPLILAAVDYEIALYRTINKYPRLAEEAVEGAPNGLKSGEMHARALEAIQRCYDKKVDDMLSEYNHKVGGGASNRLKEIVPASHDGRVLTLLVSDSLETTGVFDTSTNSVKGRETGKSEDEDLVNDAVAQTILHAGKIYVVPNAKMPHGTPLAAIYRF